MRMPLALWPAYFRAGASASIGTAATILLAVTTMLLLLHTVVVLLPCHLPLL